MKKKDIVKEITRLIKNTEEIKELNTDSVDYTTGYLDGRLDGLKVFKRWIEDNGQ